VTLRSDSIQVRRATAGDGEALIGFNAAMALETERKVLLPKVVSAGVHYLLKHPGAGFYVVAQSGRQIAGALMVTNEWSDWRNGNFWWIQSVYVRPEFRRRGVYRQLYRHLQTLAAHDSTVCGFRLYVERDNVRAQATYRTSGMHETRYIVFEELKPGIRFYELAEK
jgi:ribosomal protein S18 acetylase RimI-like enzyme